MRYARTPVLWMIVAGILLFGVAFAGPQGDEPNGPAVVSTDLPSYPPLARAACVQGSVGVVVEMGAEGQVIGTDILYGHPLLRSAAEVAAKKWQFAAVNGVVARRRQVLRFTFRILPFEVPDKRLKPSFTRPTDVEIRSHPSEPSCTHCSPRREKELRKGGCPAAKPSQGRKHALV